MLFLINKLRFVCSLEVVVEPFTVQIFFITEEKTPVGCNRMLCIKEWRSLEHSLESFYALRNINMTFSSNYLIITCQFYTMFFYVYFRFLELGILIVVQCQSITFSIIK